MIGLDTSVLVRYLMHDDRLQTAAAMRTMNSLSADAPGFLPIVVVTELVWVLQSAYSLKKREILLVLENLLRSRELILEKAEVVSRAASAFSGGSADFADYLVERSARAADCEYTVTLDRKATTSGMRLLR